MSSAPCRRVSSRAASRKPVGKLDDARLALDGFDEQGRDRVVDRRLERLEGRGNVLDTARQRLERLAHVRLAGERERAHRAAVERVGEGEHAGACAARVVQARELERGLVGLGAGVAEPDAPVVARAGQPHEPLGEFECGLGGEVVGHVGERRRLRRDRVDEHRVRMAERVHRDTGEEVEVLVARVIPHASALAALELGERHADRAHDALVEPLLPRSCRRPRSCRGTTSVPMPDCVNTSSRIECGTRPSMIAALATPPSTASRHAGIFGIMPDSSDGSSAMSSGTSMTETSESRFGQSL